MIVGAAARFLGHAAQTNLGQYWKIFAELIAIVLGLATLNLLPFKISCGKLENARNYSRRLGTVMAGLALGGSVVVSSLPCNPGIFIVIGAVILQGKIFWAILMLTMFAIGFGIPFCVLYCWAFL